MSSNFVGRLLTLAFFMSCTATAQADSLEPVRLIFDTDMGNDVDDALALGVIHALSDRGECDLLAVTTTKDHPLCAPYCDALNTFYGRGDVPLGVVCNGLTPDVGRFLELADVKDGDNTRYPHDLRSGTEAEDATTVLRRVLSQQPDKSVVIIQVGFSTNLARLLDSGTDIHSDLSGSDLVEKKVKFLSAMFGAFQLIEGRRHREYNVAIDGNAARKLVAEWPTPIVFSGYEIGYAIRYPAVSIERDFAYVEHHPLPESYQLHKATPHERPCWDLTSVLYAVRPDREYFDLSTPGRVVVDEEAFTEYEPNENGTHRYLVASENQIVRVREALAMLATQPPSKPHSNGENHGKQE